ncbi:universal stress protein [Gordonia sp. (in: high G+C Gram-positive bacteria)]|uniref:universal stress protein n=1 Tax=Gordonia sp. (in: high G+C Gram-positive bacteria) TaxID=84139 RepID=UPI0026321FFE|nr:universal stress protein [Gordonia sp. (in: high G+C Gram-positive bacteria)]
MAMSGRDLVVGVVPGQPPAVVDTAVEWAQLCRATRVHFVYVDPSRISVDGTGHEEPIDPDSASALREDRERQLRDDLDRRLSESGIPWDFHYLVGAPDRVLAALADKVDAAVLIVGTRRRGFWQDLRELVDGSVAVALCRDQRRPVVVVPQHPASGGGR